MIAESELVLKSVVAGFAISMPIGPVAVQCITRTLHKGRLSGFLSGAAAATTDTFYAMAAGLSLSIVFNFIESNKTPLQIGAGVMILVFGIQIFLKNPVKDYRNRAKERGGKFTDYLTMLPLAITNPLPLFIYAGLFSGFTLNYSEITVSIPFLLVPSVFVGALLWWFTLSGIIYRFRNKIRLRTLLRINRIAGVVILVFGLALILDLFIIINR